MMSANMFRLLFAGRFAPEGYSSLVYSLLFSLLILILKPCFLWIALPVVIFIALFFREPDRFVPQVESAVLSAADGTVVQIQYTKPPLELEIESESCLHIGVFMAPWNVHINRVPYDGEVLRKIYKKGTFSHVAREESPVNNERTSLVIQTPHGPVACVQIAGFLARRIVCHLEEGAVAEKGKKYGIICFGSHMDLYLPVSAKPCVKKGQKVRAGETIMALFSEEDDGAIQTVSVQQTIESTSVSIEKETQTPKEKEAPAASSSEEF